MPPDLLDAPAPCDCCQRLHGGDRGQAYCLRASDEDRRPVACANALRRYRQGDSPCRHFEAAGTGFVDLALKGVDVTPPFVLPPRITLPLGPEKLLWLLNGGIVEVGLQIGDQSTVLVLGNATGRNPHMPRVNG